MYLSIYLDWGWQKLIQSQHLKGKNHPKNKIQICYSCSYLKQIIFVNMVNSLARLEPKEPCVGSLVSRFVRDLLIYTDLDEIILKESLE